MDSRDELIAELRGKIAQARQVIAHLAEVANLGDGEAHRAFVYFSTDAFDPNFMPWPRRAGEGLRPEELNAANDD